MPKFKEVVPLATKPFERNVPKEGGKRNIQCFKCQCWGHIMSECPNGKAFVVREGVPYPMEDNDQEEDDFGDDEDEFDQEGMEELGDFQVPNFVTRRAMISQAMDDPSQRETLFHAKCLIKGNICFLIVDGGSCANVASSTLVEFLDLPTTKHPKPYKL